MAEGKTKVNVFSDGAWKVIQPQGDLAGAISEAFEGCLGNALSQDDRMIVFDFSMVGDMDAPAFRALVKLAAEMQRVFPPASVRVTSASDDLRQLFFTTGLDRFFDLDSGGNGE